LKEVNEFEVLLTVVSFEAMFAPEFGVMLAYRAWVAA
jgi:hypothetical protein